MVTFFQPVGPKSSFQLGDLRDVTCRSTSLPLNFLHHQLQTFLLFTVQPRHQFVSQQCRKKTKTKHRRCHFFNFSTGFNKTLPPLMRRKSQWRTIKCTACIGIKWQQPSARRMEIIKARLKHVNQKCRRESGRSLERCQRVLALERDKKGM